jgi:hypothetical protein
VELKRKATLKNTNEISTLVPGDSVIHGVGTFRQDLSYSCGAAASRNSIHGYGYGVSPNEATLRSSLGTTTTGTNFDSNISNTLNTYAPGNNYLVAWASA